MATSKPLSVAIVGGGIGGLCLAIGLLRYSHLKITIFEASHAFAEIGAGLALGPNAQRALCLISSMAEQAFRHNATSNSSPQFRKAWFDFRCYVQGEQDSLDLGIINNETGQQTVHRARFLDALAGLIPADIIHFGKRLARVTEFGITDNSPILLHFTDGTTAMADCAVGADGVHSILRKHLLGAATPEATPVFSSIVCYRGLIPMEDADKALGKYAHDAYVWCGKGAMVMTYPINFGEVLNVVAACDRKTWNDKEYVVNSTPEQLSKDFESLVGIPRRIIELLGRPMLWAMLDHLPAPQYFSRNIAIMGDAAHATTPFQGAGAGQAIEDALVLSTLLGRARCLHDIEPALAAYDIVRRPRTQRVVRTSRDAMKLFAFTDDIVDGDVEKWKQAWRGRMDWIWDIDLEVHVADALEIFGQKVGCGCHVAKTADQGALKSESESHRRSHLVV
ncbi:hypothetical protein HIM_08450 [Hirsutella minnesotensis 3608]|uniref:FAD-binding domain-containing protein n=1 Tax=Hirsutella minnesotensis 3608 TaxID=1043627 RepID=A0A0F7ZML0_9HYPO|nr:hypothetical protein HIM_08450 [Hirsutella minnesotensis 3608]